VLALVFALLVALPAAMIAQSGLPATISMYPAVAGPGDTVEVTGIDFPPGMTVVLALKTPSGKSTLATVASRSDGSFRELLDFPAGAREGTWTLSARSADGRAAYSYSFASGDASTVAPPAIPATDAVPVAAAGETTTDKLVLVIIGLVLGVLATAALYAHRMVQEDRRQPGMGTGDDVIWSGSASATDPESGHEATAVDEPHWKTAGQSATVSAATAEGPADEPETATTPAAAQEVATSA
jgi:hypothetical protein